MLFLEKMIEDGKAQRQRNTIRWMPSNRQWIAIRSN